MVMPDTARRYTVEEVLAFPDDGNRYEVVQGELLVSPSPRFAHQRGVARLLDLLRAYLKPMGLDCALPAPADITWGKRPRDAEDLVQPDVFVVTAEQAAGEWLGVSHLLLAAEVVSPSTTRADRVVKRKTYQRHGSPPTGWSTRMRGWSRWGGRRTTAPPSSRIPCAGAGTTPPRSSTSRWRSSSDPQ